MSIVTNSGPVAESPMRPVVKTYQNMEDGLAPGDELLRIEGLQMHFPITKGFFIQRQVGAVQAVDGVSFTIKKGETLGLVGESGCGKSTTGRAILQLYKPTAGSVIFKGRDITRVGKDDMRGLRKQMQMIFQDPYASLNPRMTVGDIIGEPLKVHKLFDAQGRRERIILTGDVPSPINPPRGCHFHTRCPIAIAACSEIDPPLEQKAPGHWAACIRV